MSTKQNSYKNNASIETDNNINSSMNDLIKKNICKINIENKIIIGYICIVNYYDISIPVILAYEPFFKKDYFIKGTKINLEFLEKSRIIEIDMKRRIYKDDKYNIIIIELFNKELNNKEYLEIDYNKKNEEKNYENKNVYVLINDKEEIQFIIDKIIKIEDNNIFYFSGQRNYFSNYFILNFKTHKIIGYYIYNNFNSGIFINQLIDKFINQTIDFKTNNQIILKVKVEKKNINKKIFFLSDKTSLENSPDYFLYIRKEHEKIIQNVIKELNNNNTQIYINGIIYKFSNYFIPKNEGIYLIKLVFNIKMIDCCFMFSCCNNIIEIDLSNFDTSKVINMSGMFYECKSLEYLYGISRWDTSNVIDMNFMFYYCPSLSTLPDISNWNTSNVLDMSRMFGLCKSLIYIPDISNWNISKVNKMNYMFFACKSLSVFPDVSKWNTSKLKEAVGMFERCISLSYFPDISNWDISNIKNMNYFFSDCFSLSFIQIPQFHNSIPDYYFYNCFSLINSKKVKNKA